MPVFCSRRKQYLYFSRLCINYLLLPWEVLSLPSNAVSYINILEKIVQNKGQSVLCT
jgi:hypothetical protein